MITVEKLKIHRKYHGDADMFARTGRDSEQQLFKNNEWALIEDLQQSVFLIKSSLACGEFKSAILNRLCESADEQAANMLMA